MKSSCHQAAAVETTLIVGIGSPAGDDRFGWEVIDRLREILEARTLESPAASGADATAFVASPTNPKRKRGQSVASASLALRVSGSAMSDPGNRSESAMRAPVLRKAAVPNDLLAWLDGVGHLVICDACRGLDLPGQIARWEWPAAEIERIHASGSHDLGLAAVLELAAALGALPPRVTVWACEARTVDAEAAAGGNVSAAVDAAAEQAAGEIAKEIGLA